MTTYLALIGSQYYGSCTIQPTSIVFSPEELLDMIARCGLNRLKQFATFFGQILRSSKTDPKLLHALVQLDEAQCSGVALGREEEVWAFQNGVNVEVNSAVGYCIFSIIDEEFCFDPETL